MYALLVLDMQVGLVHGPDRPWRGPELLETVNALLHKARSAGAGIFLARHIGPVGSPIEPGSPLTLLAPELTLRVASASDWITAKGPWGRPLSRRKDFSAMRFWHTATAEAPGRTGTNLAR